MMIGEVIEGLKAGRTIVIDRRDAPVLPLVLELESQGLVETEVVQIDEQSSKMRAWWIGER